MRNKILALIAALAISAPVSPITAAPKSPKLSKCDGKKRRPANPHGSILPTVDPETGTSVPAGQVPEEEPGRDGVEVFPCKSPTSPRSSCPRQEVKTIVPPISNARPKRVYQSC